MQGFQAIFTNSFPVKRDAAAIGQATREAFCVAMTHFSGDGGFRVNVGGKNRAANQGVDERGFASAEGANQRHRNDKFA
ncbi:MAG: hypothetical protein NTZ64_18295 [Polaromonas sp.]|nr:hypothetical protein [Polaromonas sp.]